MTTIQSLPLTIALDPATMRVLDTLRRKRNLNDYLGGGLDETSAEACVAQAASLLAGVHAWLQANHPELL